MDTCLLLECIRDFTYFTATKMKMRGKTSTGSLRTIPPQLLEISNTVAQLDGDVRVYVEMLVSESDIEAR